MLFIDRLRFFHPRNPTTGLAWLPIVAQDPDDEWPPHRDWRPHPWLLDTGCSHGAWVNDPFVFRKFGIDHERVRKLVLEKAQPVRLGVASGAVVYGRPYRLRLALRSNIPAYHEFPYPLHPGNPGVLVRDVPALTDPDMSPLADEGANVPLLLGMGHLHRSGLRVHVDAANKHLSVWVDRGKWRKAAGDKVTHLGRVGRRVWSYLPRRLNVWTQGRTTDVLDT